MVGFIEQTVQPEYGRTVSGVGGWMVTGTGIMVQLIAGVTGYFITNLLKSSMTMSNTLNYEVKVSNFDGAGTKITEYTVSDQLHRANGPARVWSDGDFSWWLRGCRHRYYGPAASWSGWVIMDKTVRHRR